MQPNVINELESLSNLYYNMYQEAVFRGDQTLSELYSELMKYTRHLQKVFIDEVDTPC
jgi:hypothetical protein